MSFSEYRCSIPFVSSICQYFFEIFGKNKLRICIKKFALTESIKKNY